MRQERRRFGGWRDPTDGVLDVGVEEIERDFDDGRQAGESGQLGTWRFVGRVAGTKKAGTRLSGGYMLIMHLRDVSGRYMRLVVDGEGASNLWDVELGDYVRATTIFVRDSHPHNLRSPDCRCELFSNWSTNIVRLSAAPAGVSIGL